MLQRCLEFLSTYEAEMLRAGRELDRAQIPALSDELFTDFFRTGDRLPYENVYFRRRRFLTVYAMLSIMHGRDSDLRRLEEVIGSVCRETCWALPAHVDKSRAGWELTVDLFSAETAFSLAEIISLLRDKLSEDVCNTAREEVFRRVLEPFMATRSGAYWWETAESNWCAVCAGAIGSAAIWLMADDPRQSAVLARVNAALEYYIRGFRADGACIEGVGYYTYGMSFFAAYADLLLRHTGGNTDLLSRDNLAQAARFPQKCLLPGNILLPFSDILQGEKLRFGLSAYLSRRFPGIALPDAAVTAGLDSDSCCRYGILSRDYFWAKELQAQPQGVSEVCSILQDVQWAVFRSKNGCAAAVKGGHNDEPHNHNDVGSFLYTCRGQMILDDLGAGEYTRDYFSERRYEDLCCRSLGHSVPLIDGAEQKNGRAFAASGFDADSCGNARIEFAGAYGLPADEQITRAVAFSTENGECRITDQFHLRPGRQITENLITCQKVQVTENGFRIFAGEEIFAVTAQSGRDFRVLAREYSDHVGNTRQAFLLQWETNSNRAEISITQIR